jgi:hypothetical protein
LPKGVRGAFARRTGGARFCTASNSDIILPHKESQSAIMERILEIPARQHNEMSQIVPIRQYRSCGNAKESLAIAQEAGRAARAR